MKLEEQVPRNALVWIVLAQFVLLLPHLGRVPFWVLFIYLGAAAWRIMVYQGRWSFPGRYTKAALTISCFGGVALSYRSLIGLEPTVALLLIAYALKLIELADRRDAYMVIFIAYFVCVTEFLFSQELLMTLYMLFAVLVNTTALVALHQPGQDRFRPATLRGASVMLAQSFPLMILLFFVFPRIGPLWSVPLKSSSARSGVSDFMSPGDIANLSLSDEVAFRVQFDGNIPPRSKLYWRGLVFSRLDENTWRSLRWAEIPGDGRRATRPLLEGEPLDYSIILEPTQQNWLYVLPYAATSDRGIMASNDFRLVSPVPVQDQKRYQVRSWLQAPLETSLAEWRRSAELQLPATGSPRSRALAQAMFDDAGGDALRYAQDVLSMFTRDEFFYTLQPPLLGDDPVDDFLFQSRRGFCEHYAAAFGFLMRAAGVPARVVAGYQGGEVNPVNGTVIVHQFDAHAWNEIWLQGRGWIRVDPTAAIAPDRIEFGLEQALQGEGSFLANTPLSPLHFRNINWINSLRLQLDAVNYSWQLFVLKYDSDQQYQLFNRLMGQFSSRGLVLLIVGLWVLILLPIVVATLWRRKGLRLDPATRAYSEFCDKLSRSGLARARQEAPGDYARRVTASRPELAAEVSAITRTYEAISYRSQTSPDGLAMLQRQVRRFRPASG
ncbi:MAG: DUF3488 and transglutaminase-like domain-containing protein [Halieaceae bacterium]